MFQENIKKIEIKNTLSTTKTNSHPFNASDKYHVCVGSKQDRQVTERVNIENFKGEVLMNRRNEMGGVRLERMQYRRWGGN